ncbi:MAG TPA: hypothetical protein VEF76_01100 [Patescibacteria group bacterium]|nr:hypothetical protein [Patescibacteria group bacterium]
MSKSQFLTATNNFSGGDFLLGSLNLAAADTRKGFDAPTAELVTKMTGYVEANPQSTNAERFNKYVDKITPAQKSATPRATVKLGSSM